MDNYKKSIFNAGSGIRTHELLQDRVLNPAPLARLGNPRIMNKIYMNYEIISFNNLFIMNKR